MESVLLDGQEKMVVDDPFDAEMVALSAQVRIFNAPFLFSVFTHSVQFEGLSICYASSSMEFVLLDGQDKMVVDDTFDAEMSALVAQVSLFNRGRFLFTELTRSA